MYESPYWTGWAADTWGVSWGYNANDKPIEVEDELHKGGPDGKGRSSRGKSRYADSVFDVDREGGKYQVRPAAWKAPWQPKEDPAVDTVSDVPSPKRAIAVATQVAESPVAISVSHADLLAAAKSVDQVIAAAKVAVDDMVASRRADEAAIVTAMLLLMDDDD